MSTMPSKKWKKPYPSASERFLKHRQRFPDYYGDFCREARRVIAEGVVTQLPAITITVFASYRRLLDGRPPTWDADSLASQYARLAMEQEPDLETFFPFRPDQLR
jgi:uncharacterized protein (DUF924 family)